MIKVYFDGACEPVNPKGIATYGYAVYRDGRKIRENYGLVEVGRGATNNIAEYTALIKALEYLISTNKVDEKIIVYSDSQLVVRQLNGYYMVWSENIRPLYDHVMKMLPLFKDIRFKWIPREENEEADYLSKKAYYEYLDKHPEMIEKYKKYMISDKQRRYIIGLCRKLSKDIPEHLDKMSKREGSKLIDSLLNQISEH